MEIANSPAKFWDALRAKGYSEDDFHEQRHPIEMGTTVLDVVEGWHEEYAQRHVAENDGESVDLDRSVYLTLSYSKPDASSGRQYQLHSFDLAFPKNLHWEYKSRRCLTAFDPNHPAEPLIDWYGLSGGQLKYYPRASNARYASAQFHCEDVRSVSLAEKASRYWPEKWAASGGKVPITPELLASELESYCSLFTDEGTKTELLAAARKLRQN